MKPFIPVLSAEDRGKLATMIPGEAAVRMDGECLLCAAGPLPGPFYPDACETMRFCALHIEPIEDEP